MSQQSTRSLTDMYGYAYRKAEETGVRTGITWLIYSIPGGGGMVQDVAEYFAPPETWWSTDIAACEQATGRVLVIGCGAGRHALAVAKTDHDVIGLEPSADAAGVACRRGVDARRGGLPDLPAGLGTFDTFLLAGGGLHLLTLSNERGTALERLAEVANPGAHIIGTMIEDPAEVVEREWSYRVRVQHEGVLTEWSDWSATSVIPSSTRLTKLLRGSPWIVEDIQYKQEFFHGDMLSPERLEALDHGCPWTPSDSDIVKSEPQSATGFLARLRLNN